MNREERLLAAAGRRPVDRPPFALWRHFPEEDRTAAGLARATLEFHRRFPSDFLKVTFPGGYAVADWGCREAERAEADGHRPCAAHAVNAPEDWKRIRPLDPGKGAYGEALEAVRRIAGEKPDDAPVVPTLFSPLSLARKLCGDRLKADLIQHPAAVLEALEAVTETQLRFAERCLQAGARGFFYSIQAASLRHHTDEEYGRLGEPFDRRILSALCDRSPFTILHAHGDGLLFARLAALPSHAVNWEDRSTPPSLDEGKRRVRGAVVGGLNQWKTLRDGSPAQVRAEVEDAIRQTEGLGLIVGPGCVIPPDAPPVNLEAVLSAVGASGARA